MNTPAEFLRDWMAMPLMLRMACRLAVAGVAVHWLRGPQGGEVEGRGKQPRCKGWQDTPWQGVDRLRATYWSGCNLGIHTGRVPGARLQLLGVDFDDADALAWGRQHIPPSPLRVRTRQGEHWYYLRPRTEGRCGNRAKVGGLRIDIRCDDGNIVFPPSVHPSGFVYELLDPLLPETFDALPVFDYGWLPAPAAPPVPGPSVTSARSLDQTGDRAERRAIALCRRWQVNERSQGHGTDTFKLAGMLLFSIGLPVEDAAALMLRYYNPRCPHPYTEPELRRKVLEAALKLRDRGRRLADERPQSKRGP